jgi:peptidoglycan lytic transglycosylase
MGAAPGHQTLTPPTFQALMPVIQQPQKAKIAEPVSKPYQIGKASWYGELFQGKQTASGEDYDMYDLTAAHRDLPLGTVVRVTNLSNKRSVVVRVNDRGPVTPGRVIDLSYRAARALEMHQNGLQKVRIDIVKSPEDNTELASARSLR